MPLSELCALRVLLVELHVDITTLVSNSVTGDQLCALTKWRPRLAACCNGTADVRRTDTLKLVAPVTGEDAVLR